MNKKIKAFLDEVCFHINCKIVHKEIREELYEHINELKEENIKKGYDEEEALDLAISAMGSTDEIGTKLNHQHKPQIEWSILILTAIIAIIGVVIMFSSSKFAEGQAIIFSRYIVFSAIGMSIMVALCYFDYTKLKNIPTVIYIFGILLLVITRLIGHEFNGVKKFLLVGNFSISSPEFASLLFLIAFGGFIEKYRGKTPINILKLIVLGTFSVFFLLMIRSTSTAFIMVITYGVALITAIMRNHFRGSKKNQLISLFVGGGIPAIFLTLNVIANPYKLKRLTAFFRAKEDPLGMGWQQHMADTWLALSNWFGKTEATYQGHSLNMTMPNSTGEYILVNIIVTFGWAVGVMLVFLIGAFIIRAFTTTRKIKSSYGFYLSLSACTILSAQFVISILINFSLFPMMGVNMPFVSYSGTAYIISMALVGIILSVWRRNNLISYTEDIIKTSSEKGIVSFSDGKLTIDLKAWRQ